MLGLFLGMSVDANSRGPAHASLPHYRYVSFSCILCNIRSVIVLFTWILSTEFGFILFRVRYVLGIYN